MFPSETTGPVRLDPASLPDLAGAKVVVTGGLGFVGSNLAVAAASQGARVTVVDACLPQYGFNHANVEGARTPVEVVVGDIRDLETMRRCLQGADVVFDCAAQVSHSLSVKDAFLDVDINCRGTLTVLEAARAVAPRAHLVFASTRGVIGRTVYSPIDEAHPNEPTDMNGIDKLAGEKYYRLYGDLYGLWTSSLRISNTYGPRGQMRNDDYGVVNYFLRKCMRREPITIHGEGLQLRDYNHVYDVVRAFFLAATKAEAKGHAFLLGSGAGTALITMIDTMRELTGFDTPVTKVPRPHERQAIEIGNYVVTIEKARRLLGWSPTIGTREGLAQTLAFYAEDDRLARKYL